MWPFGRRLELASCVLCSEPASWPHAWHSWCLNSSFRAHSEPGILLPSLSSSFLLLCLSPCVSVSLLSGIHLFLFYLHPSLCLPDLPFIMLPYLTMSSDTSPLLSASLYFHPLSLSTSLVFLSSSLYPGLSALSFLFWFLPLQPAPLRSVTLPELLTHTRTHVHTHAHAHKHTQSESHTDTPWLRLAGLFELCGIALRDCVQLCMWHIWCVFMHVHMLTWICVCVHMCSRECLKKCEIEDLRQLHLSWGCNFKAKIHNFPHVQTTAEMTENLVLGLWSRLTSL